MSDIVSEGVWYDHHTDTDGHTTMRGRVYGVTPYKYADCAEYGCRPVVVIDPEDREQVQRLTEQYKREFYRGKDYEPIGSVQNQGERCDAMQAALREFANPTPPKPDEPTGLGAVVEDAKGRKWVRTDTPDQFVAPWVLGNAETGSRSQEYADIAVVKVLSEGVR